MIRIILLFVTVLFCVNSANSQISKDEIRKLQEEISILKNLIRDLGNEARSNGQKARQNEAKLKNYESVITQLEDDIEVLRDSLNYERLVSVKARYELDLSVLREQSLENQLTQRDQEIERLTKIIDRQNEKIVLLDSLNKVVASDRDSVAAENDTLLTIIERMQHSYDSLVNVIQSEAITKMLENLEVTVDIKGGLFNKIKDTQVGLDLENSGQIKSRKIDRMYLKMSSGVIDFGSRKFRYELLWKGKDGKLNRSVFDEKRDKPTFTFDKRNVDERIVYKYKKYKGLFELQIYYEKNEQLIELLKGRVFRLK